MENKIYKRIAIIAMMFAIGITGMQIVSATVPNPGHLLSELECNNLFCINTTAGTVTIGGGTAIPLIVNGRITSTGTPINSTDVATKGYVDSLIGTGVTMHKIEAVAVGTTTWTVPAGISVINMTLVGGGGGGGAGGTCLTWYHCHGAGGGSGYVETAQAPVQAGDILTILVGAGGAVGSTGNQTAVFINGTILAWANGGGGGYQGTCAFVTPGGVGRCSGGSGADCNSYGGAGNTAGTCGGAGAIGYRGIGYGAGGAGGDGGGGAGGYGSVGGGGAGIREGAPGYALITYY